MQAASTHEATSQTSSGYLHWRPHRLEAAASRFPGRVPTMIHVAWLSSDPRVRSVAQAWRSLSAVAKTESRIEDLCRAAGISNAHFMGDLDGIAKELGIQRRIQWNGEDGDAFPLRTALGRELMDTHQMVRLCSSPPAAWRRYRNRLLDAWNRRASDEAAALRRRARLSQSQFASLFMTTVRTVRRWEARCSALTTRQQFFLRLFMMYVERNGLGALRHRFLPEALRYGSVGRPRV